jgi:hypothetical protein
MGGGFDGFCKVLRQNIAKLSPQPCGGLKDLTAPAYIPYIAMLPATWNGDGESDMPHSRFPHLVRREKEALCNPSRRPLERQTKLARTVALLLGQAEL